MTEHFNVLEAAQDISNAIIKVNYSVTLKIPDKVQPVVTEPHASFQEDDIDEGAGEWWNASAVKEEV